MDTPTWTPDILGDGFEMTHILHPDDYSGHVRSTVIRKLSREPSATAILYVHGFSDYFLQGEMASMFVDHRYDFYAVDLRRYGRSLLPGQKMFQVRDLHEYFSDIEAAIEIIEASGCKNIVLMGHSTGGLTTSLYLSEDHSPLVKALILNSPFLDWNLPWIVKKAVIPLAAALGRIFPDVKVHQKPDDGYARSLLSQYEGEWDYRRDWKPDVLPDPDLGWIRAIHTARQDLRRGRVRVPVLLMHSEESVKPGDSDDKYHRADAILDVESISRYGRTLGRQVTDITIPDGLHDLALSRRDVRLSVYSTMLSWLNEKGL